MMVTFETDCGMVILPETSAELVDPAKAREAIARDRKLKRSHLFPLLDATARFACSWMIVPQGAGAFDVPRAPWMVAVGDDLHFAWGPKAFDAPSLQAAIKAADHCVLMTCGIDPWPYRIVATLAVRDRKNVLLVESLPHQQAAWREQVRSIRGEDFPITICMPAPEECRA